MTHIDSYNGFNARSHFMLRGKERKSAAFLQQKREEDARRNTYRRTTLRDAEQVLTVKDPSRSPPGRDPLRRLLSVEFVWPYGLEEGSKVAIAGSFSNWKDRVPLEFDPETRVWSTSLKLHPGVYMYKFVIGGDKWCHDMNRESTRDADGNINNVIRVTSHMHTSVAF